MSQMLRTSAHLAIPATGKSSATTASSPKRVAIDDLPDSQRGATLVEILVAMLIFSIGMLGYAAIQTRGLKESFDNGQRTVAVWQVQELIDRVQINSLQVNDYIDSVDGFSLADDCGTPAQYCAATSDAVAETCTAEQLSIFDVWDTLCNTPAETTDGTTASTEIVDVVFDLDCASGVDPCPANTDVVLTYIWISRAAQDDARIAATGADSTDNILDDNEQRYQVRFRP